MVIDLGRLYLSGGFTAIGATARPGLAAINLADGPALAAWSPQLPALYGIPIGLAITSSALYVGASYSDGTQASSSIGSRYGLLICPLSAPPPIATATSTRSRPQTSATATATSTQASTATPTATATVALSPSEPYRVYLPQLRR